MLDAFIIEELKRREQRRREEQERPVLRLPVDDDHQPRRPNPRQDGHRDIEELEEERRQERDGERERGGNRGVIVIDI